ncbi:centrosomal protein of 63 kDa-like isoform X2 [Mya arenaria]|uniref:centrosomal protein of 63 kDa-like isoform X2 n=1 Tax=Mya arenaria TaxID=6604 RepID=UPI0022E3C3D9|nr:centrosomal protein of 63 kDa-like isoform X2 [Mya arenaria]
MDTPITGLWSELQRENKLPKGALSVNCEPELQELMKQIDKLVAGKKREWEREREGLASRLNVREQENQMQKTTLEQKHKEIGQLRVQLDSSENKQRDLVSQYENQLSSLRAEVQNLKREYERLHKRYSKHKRESEKEREKSTVELQGGMQEVHKLNKKVEEYRQRSRDWEIDRRSLQKQVENLEAQRKAIADKCEFVQTQFDELETHRASLIDKCSLVQQQAQTYQSQLDRRREILDSTEFSLNSQIAQLEAKLNTTAESLKIQNSKVDKLKGSLEEAMDSHKKAMDDNERLLNDLKKANAQCRKLEDLNAELQGELRARDDFLQMSEEDSRQHENNIAVLNKQIQKKDDIIKSLSDTRCQTEDETITTLRKTVDEVQDQARLSKRNEDLLGQENRQLQQELGIKRDDCENMERKLHQKKQDVARLEEEVATVKLQLSAAEEKLSSINVHHEAELITIKEQLSKVSNELESSSTNLGDVGARARDLEEQVTDGRGEIKKRDAELKVANAQIEALRLENRHLRQTIIQQTQVNLDHTETETQLREMQQTYQAQIKSLEKDNVSLRDELGVMRQEVTALEDRFDHQLQRTIHEAEMSHTEELSREQRHLQDLEEDADRRVSMLQDRLDSTINRYEEQLTLLRRQKARVEDDLDRERRAGSSFRQGDIVIEEGEEGVIYVNDDMSLADTDSGNEMNFGIPASEKFLNEEAARTRQLESIIDCHIQTLKSSSDMAIKKHKR